VRVLQNIPQYFANIEEAYGSALRIGLSPHSLRVYSTDTTYITALDAKQACAKIALDQGVLEFIKYGNGQSQPTVRSSTDGGKEAIVDPTTVPILSLQSFYESLPRPFPEDVGDKTAVEINAPCRFNTAVQHARGGKLSTTFIWIAGESPGRKCCTRNIALPFLNLLLCSAWLSPTT